jgi:hypothetical protein
LWRKNGCQSEDERTEAPHFDFARNARKNMGDLTELAASIREHGVINPIIVELAGDARFRVIAGERGFAACRLLGFTTVGGRLLFLSCASFVVWRW